VLQPIVGRGGRRDQDPLHPLLFEEVEVTGLLGGVVIAIAQDDCEAGVVGGVFNTSCDIGEERVGDVEDDKPDRAAVAGAQLPGRLVADEAEIADRVEDPSASRFGDDVGSVEDVGDRADRDAGHARDVTDAHWVSAHGSLVSSSPVVTGLTSGIDS
jgi:hypothetical protein